MSWIMKAATAYLQASAAAEKRSLGARLDAARERLDQAVAPGSSGEAEIPQHLYEVCDTTLRKYRGARVMTLRRENRPLRHEVIYLHGGGFVVPLKGRHWGIVEKLMGALRARITLPLYGLAPQYSWKDAYPFLDQVFAQVLVQRAQHEKTVPEPARGKTKIILAGDAAGGGLALAYAMDRRDRGLPLPDELLLFSPWLDLTLSQPETDTVQDPLLDKQHLLRAGQAWAADADPRDPRLSPYFGEAAGLPPVHIYQGGKDLMYPAVIGWSDRARAAGAEVRVTVYPDAFNGYTAVQRAPEVRKTFSDIARRLG